MYFVNFREMYLEFMTVSHTTSVEFVTLCAVTYVYTCVSSNVHVNELMSQLACSQVGLG